MKTMDWETRKFGCVSLMLSAIEILVVWGGVALSKTSIRWDWNLVRHVLEATYLIGALGSVTFAVVGLAMDNRRTVALLAVIVALVAFVICGLPMVA
jgi:hypothetical protein